MQARETLDPYEREAYGLPPLTQQQLAQYGLPLDWNERAYKAPVALDPAETIRRGLLTGFVLCVIGGILLWVFGS